MTTYGYVRVSTDEQVKGTSPKDQRDLLMALGATVIFEDEGVSGSIPLDKRKRGGEMYSALVPGDTIIAAKLDRLFRDALDALEKLKDLKTKGVSLILVDMGLTPVTDNGVAKMFFTMLAGFAELERDRIRTRTADGRKCKRDKGGHIGGTAPFGYEIVGKGKEALLKEKPEEIAAIAEMVAMRANNCSLRAIATQMRIRGFTISKTAIARILRDKPGNLAAVCGVC